jgi:hypothetical protein
MSPDQAQRFGNDLACLAANIAEIAEEIKALYDFDHDEPEAQQEPEPPKAKEITLEDVRAVLMTKTQAGFREQVQAAIQKRAAKLSLIDPADYPALLAEAEEWR